MVTDNPRAVDDSSIQTKDQLNRVVFYVSALIILINSVGITYLPQRFTSSLWFLSLVLVMAI